MHKDNTHSKKTKRNPLLIPCVLLFCSTIVCIIICIIINAKSNSHKNNNSPISLNSGNYYTQADIDNIISSASSNAAKQRENEIKSEMINSLSAQNPNISEYLRNTFPEKIVYYGDGAYHFDDISPNIPHNSFKRDDFILDDNTIMKYTGDNNESCKIGIDVSQFQGEIDWKTVAENDIDFVMIRVGYRGYGSGALVLDEQFENNVKGALENDIPVGVYFFTQATTIEEQKEEIQFILNAIKPYKITYPVAIDVEKPDSDSARGNSVSKENRTKFVKLFCDEIVKSGYIPMIYGNTYSYFSMLDMENLAEYNVWFAFYDKYIYYPYVLKMWQYSEKASIPGIEGNTDINILLP